MHGRVKKARICLSFLQNEARKFAVRVVALGVFVISWNENTCERSGQDGQRNGRM